MDNGYEIVNHPGWVDIIYTGNADAKAFLNIASILYNDGNFKDKPCIWHFKNPESILCLDDTVGLLKNIKHIRPPDRKLQKNALVLSSSSFVLSAAEFATQNNPDILAKLRIFENYEDAREWISTTPPERV